MDSQLYSNLVRKRIHAKETQVKRPQKRKLQGLSPRVRGRTQSNVQKQQ